MKSSQAGNKIRNLVHEAFRFYLIGPYDLSPSLSRSVNYICPMIPDAFRRLSDSFLVYELGVHLLKLDTSQSDQFRDFG